VDDGLSQRRAPRSFGHCERETEREREMVVGIISMAGNIQPTASGTASPTYDSICVSGPPNASQASSQVWPRAAGPSIAPDEKNIALRRLELVAKAMRVCELPGHSRAAQVASR